MSQRSASQALCRNGYLPLLSGLVTALGLFLPETADAQTPPQKLAPQASALAGNSGRVEAGVQAFRKGDYAPPGAQTSTQKPGLDQRAGAGVTQGPPGGGAQSSGVAPAAAAPVSRTPPSTKSAGAAVSRTPPSSPSAGAAAAPVNRTPPSNAAAIAPGVPASTAPAASPVNRSPTNNAAAIAPGVPAPAATPAPAAAVPPARVSATDGVAVVAPQSPAEQKAANLANAAINRDYTSGRNRAAEKKLRQALELCLNEGCSVPFRARLNRDIGIVYVGGMRHVEDGKDEFATALTADPTVAIPAALNTRAVNDAFLAVKQSLSTERDAPAAAVAATPQTNKPSNKAAETPFNEPQTDTVGRSFKAVANWISLGIEQDFLIHSATQNVCNDGSRYVCYDGNVTEQNFTKAVGAQQPANGNEISASGVRFASIRILLGYERLLTKNIGVGLKIGTMVHGAAPRRLIDPKVFQLHGEARLTIYPGSDPFGSTRHVRPYLFASGGFAEIDGTIPVQVVYQNGTQQQLVAWKRTGKYFGGGGAGIVFPISQGHGPFVEGRFVRMFEKPSYAMMAMAGYQVGF